MKKIIRYVLILIGAPLGCLIFVLIFLALSSIEFYGNEILSKYIISNPYLLIGLAILFFIIFILTKNEE